jgi:hypothetical protein
MSREEREMIEDQLSGYGIDPKAPVWEVRQMLKAKLEETRDPMDRCLITLLLKQVPETVQ